MERARVNARAKMMAMVFMGVLILTVGVIDEGAGICEGR
jgi:hypothetical protein